MKLEQYNCTGFSKMETYYHRKLLYINITVVSPGLNILALNKDNPLLRPTT